MQVSEDPVRRWKWVDYSAFDSKATWDLYHSLREKLQSTECNVDEKLRKGMCGNRNSYTQWDLYLDVWKPFGTALTEMEQVGRSRLPLEGFIAHAGAGRAPCQVHLL
jgi:hypothetical protein